MQKMAAHDDPQTFMEMFEATAAACGWPVAEWAVRLLPLLSGDAQSAALGLPAPSRGQYGEIKRAVLDRLGLTAEDHRRRFRGSRLGPADRPFVFAQQLRDAATRWLRPGGSAGEDSMLGKIVLEQFVEGLPAATADWVLCHRPADLAGAITLAEDHLAVLLPGPGTGGPAGLSRWAHTDGPERDRGRVPHPRITPPLVPSPGPARAIITIGPPPSPAQILLAPFFLPRVQPLRALLSTHRGLVRRQGRSVGGVDNSDTSEGSAHSWKWAR